MDDLQDIEEIKRLKGRYFRYMDTKRWDDWRHLFAPACRFEGTSRRYDSVDEFVSGTRARLDEAVTVHHGHMPEIVLLDEVSARGIWAMFDRVEFPTLIDHGRGAVGRGFTGYGHYEEAYEKVYGEWRIASLRLTRLALWPVPDEASPALREGVVSSIGRDWLEGR
jgi:hypothetical protein